MILEPVRWTWLHPRASIFLSRLAAKRASWSVINHPMSARMPNSGKKAAFAVIFTVAATYAYFLLFAQFGFLHALQLATNGEQAVINHVLAVMGVAGISGSIFTALVFTGPRGRAMLAVGFIVCAAAASTVATGAPEKYFPFIAGMIGLGTGVVTVAL